MPRLRVVQHREGECLMPLQSIPASLSLDFVVGVLDRLYALRMLAQEEGVVCATNTFYKALGYAIWYQEEYKDTTMTLCLSPEGRIIARWFFRGQQCAMKEF